MPALTRYAHAREMGAWHEEHDVMWFGRSHHSSVLLLIDFTAVTLDRHGLQEIFFAPPYVFRKQDLGELVGFNGAQALEDTLTLSIWPSRSTSGAMVL